MLVGQRTLCTLSLAAELGERAGVGADVSLVLFLDEFNKVLHDTLVKVLTTQVRVTAGRHDLEYAVVDGQDGHVKRATAEIKHEDVLLILALLVEAIGNGSSRGLVDDAHDVEAGNGAGILGGLTLGVVEVGGDGDDRVLDGLAEEGLGSFLHLGEHHGGDLFGGEDLLFVVDIDRNDWLASLVDDLVGKELGIPLHLLVLVAVDAVGAAE